MTLMDGQVADRLQQLENDGLAENTIVFYYGDNGGVTPRSKRFLQRSGTHVPLILISAIEGVGRVGLEQ